MGKEPTLRKVKILLHVEAAQRLSDEQKTLITNKENNEFWPYLVKSLEEAFGEGVTSDNLADGG